MIQEESGLFQVRFNEEGKKFIRKFAVISYTMLVLVVFLNLVSVYWNAKILAKEYYGFASTLYDKAYPYVSIFFSLLALAANMYYLRFPIVLLRSIKVKDEFGANKSFRLLFRGALIFLVWMILDSINIIWSFVTR